MSGASTSGDEARSAADSESADVVPGSNPNSPVSQPPPLQPSVSQPHATQPPSIRPPFNFNQPPPPLPRSSLENSPSYPPPSSGRVAPILTDYFFGKVIAITGGGGGLAYATALRLLQLGASVSLVDNQDALLRAVFHHLSQHVPANRIFFSCVDVRHGPLTRRWLDDTEKRFGKLDGAVNFAGIDTSGWQETMDINLTGTMVSVREELRHMKTPGAIINVASVLALTGVPTTSDYAASKAGVISFSKCVAAEQASEGIRVNVIAPGPIATSWMGSRRLEFDQVLGAPWTTLIPMGRMGQPEEVAHLVEFLLNNEKSSYITGAVIPIDGGFTA